MWTKRAHQAVLVVASAAALTLAASSASADIIFDSAIVGLGQGFGAANRLITVEKSHGTESACDSNVGGVLSQTCSGLDASFQPNGLIDAGGNDVNGSPKNALANLSALGITNAESIVLIYNPSQTGSKPATDIHDILLKFYDSSNNLVISVDGGCGSTCTDTSADPLYFSGTGVNLGNGGTGFALILDATQAAAVDAACAPLFTGCTTMAAEVTIGLANDGPDSFLVFNKNVTCTEPPPICPGTENVPEPITLSLFGAGLVSAVAIRRRRRKSL
jgi:hypothetical protein